MSLTACQDCREPRAEAQERADVRERAALEAVRDVGFGRVVITVCGGQIVEIEKQEKQRFPAGD